MYIIDKQKDFQCQRQEEIDIEKQQKICSVKSLSKFQNLTVHVSIVRCQYE